MKVLVAAVVLAAVLATQLSMRFIECGGDGVVVLWRGEGVIVECQKEEKVGQMLVYERKEDEASSGFGQKLEVYSHVMFGKILMIDGTVQVVEYDEAAYHEMMVHVPMGHFPNAEKMLIIGGGDGGCLLRAVQHAPLSHIDIVDIDLRAVRDIAVKWFPHFKQGFEDSRVVQHQACAAEFIQHTKHLYDIVVVDATDCENGMEVPTGGITEETLGDCGGSSGPLFLTAFYKDMKNKMTPDGILVRNLDSPSWDSDTVSTIVLQLRKMFKDVYLCHFHVSTFLSGHYSFAVASDDLRSVDAAAWHAKSIGTEYYTSDVHTACYALPRKLEKILGRQ